MPRTNIAVDEETAKALADEANRENKSMYALTNEVLDSVIKICEYGGAPRELYPSWRWSRILRDTDAIPLPGGLMEELMKKMYASDKEWLLGRWFEEGKRIGSYLHMYAEDFRDLIPRVGEMQGFLPVKRVEFQKTEENGRPGLSIHVVGAGFSNESTSCTEQFLRGILSAYPYKVTSSKVSEGMIELHANEERLR